MLIELNWIETQVQIQFNPKIVKVWSDHKVAAFGIAWDRYYSVSVWGRKGGDWQDTSNYVSASERVLFTAKKCHDTLQAFTDTKTFCFLKLSWCEKSLSLPFLLSQTSPILPLWDGSLFSYKIQQLQNYVSKSERNKVATIQSAPRNVGLLKPHPGQ